MILGIGSDVVNIARIQRLIDTYGDRFLDKVFTSDEKKRADVKDKSVRAGILAKRYAAKEAVAKALGTGVAEGILLRHIGVKNLGNGRPVVKVTDQAEHHLKLITPEGMDAKIELSLSDDPPVAQAFVIISAVPKK